jgi:G:T-mismatch repair DNA endonuclease (very short patch repair protein)
MKLFTVPDCVEIGRDLCASGRVGSTLFRELVMARSGGYVAPESELEARFIELVVAAGFEAPVRQLALGDDGGFIGRVDFAWPSARLIVEVDGRRWHGAKLNSDADEQRRNRLTAAGWHVLTISWEQLTRRPHEVVALLSRFLRRAA